MRGVTNLIGEGNGRRINVAIAELRRRVGGNPIREFERSVCDRQGARDGYTSQRAGETAAGA